MVSHINKGSPSQPCPKLMMGKGAVSNYQLWTGLRGRTFIDVGNHSGIDHRNKEAYTKGEHQYQFKR